MTESSVISIEGYPFIIRFKTPATPYTSNYDYLSGIEGYPFIIRFKTSIPSSELNINIVVLKVIHL